MSYHLEVNKTPLENVLNLINANFHPVSNHRVLASEVTLGTITPITPNAGNEFSNTEIIVTPIPASPLKDPVTIKYKRIDLAQNHPTIPQPFQVVSADTLETIKQKIYQQWGYLSTEITIEYDRLPNPGKTEAFIVKANNDSLVYLPGSQFTINVKNITPEYLPILYLSAQGLPVNSRTYKNAINGHALISGTATTATVAEYTWNNDYSFYNPGDTGYAEIPYTEVKRAILSNFTIELYACPRGWDATTRYLIGQVNTAGGDTHRWGLSCTNGALAFFFGNGAGSTITINSSTNLVLNTWHHIAVTRQGNVFTLYLNGVSVGTATYSGPAINSVPPSNWLIGKHRTAVTGDISSVGLNFCYDEVSVWNRVRYTGSFSPGRILSLNKGEQININGEALALKNDTTRTLIGLNSGLVRSTDQKRNGLASIFSTGATPGSYGILPVADVPDIRSVDFSISIDLYPLTLDNYRTPISQWRQNSRTTSNSSWVLYFFGSELRFSNYGYSESNNVFILASSIVINKWQRVTINRKGNIWSLYIDGVRKSTVTGSVSNTDVINTPLFIGQQTNASGTGPGSNNDPSWHGYLDNIRIRSGAEQLVTV